jgi:oligoribonuclease NrnB/cAMP/cGMP phosphodiesterase (DHH superfamily)
MTNRKTFVFTHGNCVDGTSSAWVARRHLGTENVVYQDVHYGRSFPEFDPVGADVYILDFCPPVDVLLNILRSECQNLYLFDHHVTAQDMIKEAYRRLEGWENLFITFDMKRSGAGITADFFNDRNWWVNYVEDRDLWRWDLPNSKTVNAFIQSVDRTMDGYDLAFKDYGPEEAHVLGMGAERYLSVYVQEVSRQARRVSFAEFTDIPVVNAPFVGISELVGALAKDALFAVGWSMNEDSKIVFSLRSRGDFDVSALAQRFGGGGHKRAAGFTLPLPLPETLLPLVGGKWVQS